MQKVFRAAATIGWPNAEYVQILMLLPIRRVELAGLRWSEIDFQEAKLEIPARRMKGRNGKARMYWAPLTPQVIEILARLPRHEGSDFVFSRTGRVPISDFSQIKKKLDRALAGSGVPDFHFHDYRRSFTMWTMDRLEDFYFAADDVAERILAHEPYGKVQKTYNPYAFKRERRILLTAWTDYLTGEETQAIDEPATIAPPVQLRALPKPEPAPEPEAAPVIAAPRHEVHLLLMDPDDVAQAATAKAEILHALTMAVMTDPEVIRACNELLKFKLEPDSAGDRRDDYAAVFYQAAVLRVRLKLEPRPLLKQKAEEATRARFEERERAHLAAAEEARKDANVAGASAEYARKAGQDDLARRDEAGRAAAIVRAEEEERNAGIWRQMLASRPAPDDPRIVKNFAKWSLANPDAVAQGTFVEMQKFFQERFNRPCEHAAVAYANALSEIEVTEEIRRRERAAIRKAGLSPEQEAAPVA
jgi:hypothetical protein